MPSFKIIVEKHKEGYIAYSLGLNGVVVAYVKGGISYGRNA